MVLLIMHIALVLVLAIAQAILLNQNFNFLLATIFASASEISLQIIVIVSVSLEHLEHKVLNSFDYYYFYKITSFYILWRNNLNTMLKHNLHLHFGNRFLDLEIIFIFDTVFEFSLNHMWSISEFVITLSTKVFLVD